MAEITREELIAGLLESWRINQRINTYLIENVSDEAWTAKPPGGKGRTIAAIFAHVHNVRLMWLKVTAKGSALPDKADRGDLARSGAIAALAESAASIERVIEKGLVSGKVTGFPPSVAAFLGYMIAHDAHHRGQATMLARQVGHPIPAQAMFGVWEWNSRAKELDQ